MSSVSHAEGGIKILTFGMAKYIGVKHWIQAKATMPVILTIYDLEAYMETVTTIGKWGQVMRVWLLILRGGGIPYYTSTWKFTGSKKLDDNANEGTNTEGFKTNSRENEHQRMQRWSWRRWLSRPCQEHMRSKWRTICEILFQIKLMQLGLN